MVISNSQETTEQFNIAQPMMIDKKIVSDPPYLSSIFIAVLSFFWFMYGIPLLIAIILLVIQYVRRKKIISNIDNYNNQIRQAYNETVTNYKKSIDEVKHSIELKSKLKKEIAELQKQLSIVNLDTMKSDIAPFVFDSNITSEEYKNKLSLVKLKYDNIIKRPNYGIESCEMSKSQKQIHNNNIKQLLRCFNAECDIIITSVTVKNIDTMRTKMQKSFKNLNKIFSTDGIKLSFDFLENKLEELNLSYAYLLQKEQEIEQQKEIKAQMLEEEKVRREIEREKAKIEKEEKQFRGEINKLMKYIQTATDVEKQLYVDKIKELEDKLKLIEKDKENVLNREQNTRAGFVYIISNIGSFGENVYKIGMTRRLEPMDRINELSSASVPFEFDVHAMIFSQDAPSLEHILHQAFESKAVNKVNKKKEFFKVPLSEIEKVVLENYNATVIFTEMAKAEQYRQTLAIEAKG